MKNRKRLYNSILEEHFATLRQMAFLSGARQVGKTTVAKKMTPNYLNWDDDDQREIILGGAAVITDSIELTAAKGAPPRIVFDEIHKYRRWKKFLKGFFDTHGEGLKIIVTGSARLDIYRRGGDSLMGRYFLYRVHPWSIAECVYTSIPSEKKIIRPPMPITKRDWEALLEHGGFPEPFLRRDKRFTRRWQNDRRTQIAKEDLREVSRVQDLGTLEILMRLLESRSAQQLVLSNLADELRVAVNTVKNWVDLFSFLYFGFLVRPWFSNVAKALRKEPKWYLRDWSCINDTGARAETFIACHLLKAVEGWTDLGFGSFELRYLRDKMKREVDFLVVRDGKPWFLVEAKASAAPLSPSLAYFQKQTGAKHAFQVELDTPFAKVDCFSKTVPVRVPARTFFSQLL